MKKTSFIIVLLWISLQSGISQNVTIQVDASLGKTPISPFIFGGNVSLSDNSSQPTASSTWKMYRSAGVKMFRENGGNNATKYNWRLKMTSHPDWYNNVYRHDWDYQAKSLQDSIPYAYGMWAFQLIGKAASNTNNNFNDWAYNQSQWWDGVGQNLAGGGTPNTNGGGKALIEGDPSKYLMNWTADSTVGILDKWFGTGGLGLNKTTLRYWSMDNEPEIWEGTHDDVMPTQPSADEFMQSYFKVAKAARAKFPEIKLVGPVPANEWQWFNYKGGAINYNGTNYCWLEYFIKRIADEQTASGIRLLDVLDIHFYPGTSVSKDIVQLHRVFFDKNYVFPEANGVHRANGGWDPSINKEYIFARCNEWLTKYLGPNHGVTLSVSETGIGGSNSNVTAVWYASTLGTFADNGVELFTPWSWKIGMWEALHLFSRYSKEFRVQSLSSREDSVSGYSSVNTNADSLTVFLVNRSITTQQNVTVKISNMPVYGTYNKLSLYGLPATETFVSHTSNALKSGTVSVLDSTFTATLPPLSVTAVLMKKNIQPISIRYSKNPVCQGENNITYSIPQKQGAHYKWTYSGSGITIDNDTSNAVSVNFSNTATSGTLTVNAKYPADSTWTLPLTVGTPVAQPSAILSGKDPVCKGDNNVSYSVTNDATLAYSWTYSGTGATITNGTTNAASVNFGSAATSGTLTVTASKNGCSNMRTSTITVNALPTQPSTITASKSQICVGDNGVTYSVTNDATVTYNWTYSGTGASIANGTTNAVSVNYSNSATSGNLMVTAANASGCSNSRTSAITVNNLPTQPGTIVASKAPVIQGDNGITYSVTNDPTVTYNWTYSGTGATISNGNANTASVNYSSSATSGNISVVVTNSGSCSNSNSLAVTVNTKPDGIDNVSNTDAFSVIFNSVKSELLVSYRITAGAQVKIEVFNDQGRLIKRPEDSFKTPGTYDLHLSTNGLAKGVYIVRYSAGQTAVQKKFLLMD